MKCDPNLLLIAVVRMATGSLETTPSPNKKSCIRILSFALSTLLLLAFMFPSSLSASASSSPLSAATAAENAFYDAVLKNLHSVIDALPGVSSEMKLNARRELDYYLSPAYRKRVSMSSSFPNIGSSSNVGGGVTDAAEERFHQVHESAHDVIDNLGLGPRELTRVHSAVHHVFSSTTSPSHCYDWLLFGGTDDTNGSYAKLSQTSTTTHTGCLGMTSTDAADDKNKCGRKRLASGVSEDEKRLIVEFHNRVRSAVARGHSSLVGPDDDKNEEQQRAASFLHDYQPKASRMKEMKWDEELAILAQRWADQCRAESDCADCRAVPRFKVGQNLYATLSRLPIAATVGSSSALITDASKGNWTFVMDAWYNSRQFFDHNYVYEYPGTGTTIGVNRNSRFYSQMVWDETYLVGCGYVRFLLDKGDKVEHIYVCNYGPAGNIPGRPVYLTGEPCRRCPRGHVCINGVGLCSYGPPPAGLSSSSSSGGTIDVAGAAVGLGGAGIDHDHDHAEYDDADFVAATASSNNNADSALTMMCKSECVPKNKLRFCDPNTYQDYACETDEVCCRLKKGGATVNRDVPNSSLSATAVTVGRPHSLLMSTTHSVGIGTSTQPSTTTIRTPPSSSSSPAVGSASDGSTVSNDDGVSSRRRCDDQCVKASLLSLVCEAGTVFYGTTTDCTDQEVCCRVTTGTKEIAFDEDYKSSSSTTLTSSSSSSAPPLVVQCPLACLPPGPVSARICRPGSVLPNGLCQVETHVCCDVNDALLSLAGSPAASGDKITQAIDTRAKCESSCVQRDLVPTICAKGTVDLTKTCPSNNGVGGVDYSSDDVCCDFDLGLLPGVTPPSFDQDSGGGDDHQGLTSPRPSASSGTTYSSVPSRPPPPPPCEGPNMNCLASYLSSSCQLGVPGVARNLSDVFACADQRLLCCAPLDRIKKRLLEIRLKIDVPTSLATNTQCGLDSVALDRSFDSSAGPLNMHCWAVGLVNSRGDLVCMGALIETQYVTSAASCSGREPKFVEIPWSSSIIHGGGSVSKNKRYQIRRTYNHAFYNDRTLDNDLMVAVLERPVNLEKDRACLVCLRKTTAVPDFRNCSIAHVDRKGKGLGSYSRTMPVTKLDNDGICVTRLTNGAPVPVNSVCVDTDTAAAVTRNDKPLSSPLSLDGDAYCLPAGTPMFCIDQQGDGVAFLAGHLSFPSGVCRGRTTGASSDTAPLVFANAYKPWVITFFGTIIKSTAALFADGVGGSGDDSNTGIDDEDNRSNGTRGGDQQQPTKLVGATAAADGCGKLHMIRHGSFKIVCPETVNGFAVPDRENCAVDGGRYPVGTRVKYQCDDYYVLAGVPARVCRPSGEWSAEKPLCEVECGKRPRLRQQFLSIGGKRSKEGEWPWQAALVDRRTAAVECGGALIHESWVLTAAHCVTTVVTSTSFGNSNNNNGNNGVFVVRDSLDVLVFLGKLYRDLSLDDEHVQPRDVEKLVPHPRYNPLSYDSDISLVKLSVPAVLTHRVQVVCLTKDYGSSEANLVANSLGTVAGWGLGQDDRPLDQLNSVQLPVVSPGQCVRETTQVIGDASFTKVLTKDMFCAGYGLETSANSYQSVCQGDSGGPIVFQASRADPQNSPWVAEGIVSFYFERGACSKRGPGDFAVFTKINAFYQWIVDVVTTS